jgi:cytochrome P450
VHDELTATTLEIVVKTLFSAELESDVAMIAHAMHVIARRIEEDLGGLQIPLWVPTRSNRRFGKVIDEMDVLLYRLIGERRATGGPRDDLLSMLLEARDDAGDGMSDRQLRDELMTFFLAGHETTALVLSWTWYLLSQHPEARERLEHELDTVLAGRPPALADLPRLPFADQVLKESMRLYPPSWALTRRVVEDVGVGGYTLAKGSVILASQWAMHRDARYFPEPLRFVPERWADGELTRRLPRYAYFPFGGGPRICIGASFAQMEALAVLATVAQHLRLAVVPGARIELQPSLTLRPKHGLPMTVSKR